jgi:hypothetical protein
MVEMTFGTWSLQHYRASCIILLGCTTIKLTFNNISRFVIHALPVVSLYLIHNLVCLHSNKLALLYMPCPRRPMPAAIRTQLAALYPLLAA